MFTGKERTICAFEHKKADRLPVFDVVNKPDMYLDLLGQDNFDSKGRLVVQLAKKIGMDAVVVHSKPYTCLIPPRSEFDGPNTFTDRFGIKCQITDTSWPLGMAINPREADEALLQTLRSAEVTDEDVLQIKEAVEEAGGEIAVFGSVRGTFGFLFILLGLEHLSEVIYEDPDLLRELIDAADAFWTKLGLKLIEAGCDALYVANDMGMNERTLISPAHLREFFFPSFGRQIKTWKQAGGRVLLHSCGNVDAVLEDLADLGIDALNNLQVRAGMNLASAKARIGDRVTIVGNVDATGVMCQQDKSLIDRAIREVVETAGRDGALILATDHSFHEGIPTENVLYFLEKAKEYGRF